MNAYSKDNVDHRFFEEPSGRLAYFMGLFAADGCVYKKPSGGFIMTLDLQSKDSSILYELKGWLRAKAAVRRYGYRDGRVHFILKFSSYWVGEWLISRGIGPRKSLTLGVVEYPKGFEREFVRGFIDGDGCWTMSQGLPRLQIYGPKLFVEWLHGIIHKGCGAQRTGVYQEKWHQSNLIYAKSSEYKKVAGWLSGTFGFPRKDPDLKLILDFRSRNEVKC